MHMDILEGGNIWEDNDSNIHPRMEKVSGERPM